MDDGLQRLAEGRQLRDDAGVGGDAAGGYDDRGDARLLRLALDGGDGVRPQARREEVGAVQRDALARGHGQDLGRAVQLEVDRGEEQVDVRKERRVHR